MRYKLLGKSGLRVSEICLGTMTFGEDWGYGADKIESRKQFDLFLASGGNFIDTANRYTEGTSERFLGEFIKTERDNLVIATKFTLTETHNKVNGAGNHKKNMVQSVNASLKRLDTDFIDLLYLHAWDFSTPEQEIMRALDDLVRSGKVLHIAISDTPAWIVSRSNTMAELMGWTSFAAYQLEYSLLQRTPERDMIPMAAAMGMSVTAWAPLAGGALTGKYLEENDAPRRLKETSTRLNERSTAIAKEVVAIAKEIGCSATHVALNWVRKSGKNMIPIVGARTAAQVADSLACLQHDLSPEHFTRLQEVSKIEIGFPHDFLKQEG
ncbi:MAG: aldo/keto reductase, partial [Cytophagales bacterium]|nr:aldo/keto reductase [Cytophagales bacterium]